MISEQTFKNLKEKGTIGLPEKIEDLGALYVDLDEAQKLIKEKQDVIKAILLEEERTIYLKEKQKKVSFVQGAKKVVYSPKKVKTFLTEEEFLKIVSVSNTAIRKIIPEHKLTGCIESETRNSPSLRVSKMTAKEIAEGIK